MKEYLPICTFSTLPLLLSVFSPISSAQSLGEVEDSLTSTSGKLRTTFEEISLPDNEKMGFVAGTFLYGVNDWLDLGVGTYGALTGERGGFITLGIAAEVSKYLTDAVSINTGLFVGAGGGRGGYHLSGGGLMLRPHIGLNYDIDNIGSIGLGISFVSFPDGTINSTQAYLSYEYPFDTAVGDGWLEESIFSDYSYPQLTSSEREFAAIYRAYSIPSGVLTDSGKKQNESMQLLGVQWLSYFDKNWFLKIESEGAMGGQNTGYMQVLTGGGYRYSVTDSTYIKLASQVGFAGGGDVATGGGFIFDASLEAQQYLTDNLFVGLSAGYISSPDGGFKATSLAFNVGYLYGAPDINRATINLNALSNYNLSHMRLRVAQQTYLKSSEDWRAHHADLDVENLGVQGDYFISDNIYLSGQGLAAYGGQAGAYMTGQLGTGWHQPILESPVFVDIEALLGAAGGGGLALGNGFVWQTNLNLGYKITNSISIIGTVGYIDAPSGPFSAQVVGASVAYNFTTFGS